MNKIRTQQFKAGITDGNVYVKQWIPEDIESDIPIILLHDSLGCVDLWKDFPRLLAEKLSRPVIAYDRLGFGQSDLREQTPSTQFIQEEAGKNFPYLKKNLSIDQYILLGHSVGGGMAINISALDSDCKAVITIAAQAFVEDRTLKGITEAKKLFQQPEQFERLKKWHGDKAEWVLKAWTDIWLSAEFCNWSLEYCIGKVACPVQAIHGENDEYGSKAFPDYIAENSGGHATTTMLANCGHMPHIEMTEAVIISIREFLAENL